MNDRVKNDIIEVVNHVWTEKNTPVLLSQITKMLSEETKNFLRENNYKVLEYIRNEIDDQISIEPMKQYKNALAAYPKGKEINSDCLITYRKKLTKNKKTGLNNEEKFNGVPFLCFSKLTKDELSRINIPADLVFNMIDRM